MCSACVHFKGGNFKGGLFSRFSHVIPNLQMLIPGTKRNGRETGLSWLNIQG